MLSDDVLARVADHGYDPVYGARPLKRAFQKLVEDSLANQLLKGDFVAGDCIGGQWTDGGLIFERVEQTDQEVA